MVLTATNVRTGKLSTSKPRTTRLPTKSQVSKSGTSFDQIFAAFKAKKKPAVIARRVIKPGQPSKTSTVPTTKTTTSGGNAKRFTDPKYLLLQLEKGKQAIREAELAKARTKTSEPTKFINGITEQPESRESFLKRLGEAGEQAKAGFGGFGVGVVVASAFAAYFLFLRKGK